MHSEVQADVGHTPLNWPGQADFSLSPQNRKQEYCGFSTKGKSKPRCFCQRSKQEQKTAGEKQKKGTSAYVIGRKEHKTSVSI